MLQMDTRSEAVKEPLPSKSTQSPKVVKMYKVQTKDMEICEVSAPVIGKSKLITTMLEDLNLQDDDTPIPIPNVTSLVFKKIVTWCERRGSNLEATSSAEEEQWRKQYFKIDNGLLFDIIMAANYLDIPDLLDSACKVVAGMMRGKSVQEIRTLFNITNDFTPQEEEEIRKENSWED
ncbi:unnamed protein product [Cylicocyclus nassatus]|uniref:Skp1-related protein n=1 Tax=Cylicocyclus nassatus TaxID=53992 RepID=A0AA36GL69_CYLNA|nr:unnamed protein product [Cylicocyclus nassatus]